MAGENGIIDAVNVNDTDETEKRSTVVQNDLCDCGPSDLSGTSVTKSAPGKILQRLSPILELDPGENKADADSTGSSYPLSSVDKYSTGSSSTNSLTDSYDTEDTCAVIILKCLFCQFYDLCLMLPDTCEHAINLVCPTYAYLFGPLEPVQTSDWNCQCDFDCGLFDACQETGECLELALEMSELCYR